VEQEQEEKDEKKLFVTQYRENVSDEFKRTLHRINASYCVGFTVKKLKNIFPSLKSSIETRFKSWLV